MDCEAHKVLVLRLRPVSTEAWRSLLRAFWRDSSQMDASVTLLGSAWLLCRCRMLASLTLDWSFGFSIMVIGGNEVGWCSLDAFAADSAAPCPLLAFRLRCFCIGF